MDTQSHIKNIYQKDSDIINGPIDISRFKSQQAISNPETYLLVSRLENWKKVDYAIDAFNILKLPLRIVGSGKESSRLMKKANQNIKFLGSISDEELAKEYSSAKAVIFTPYLEYGLIPLEANACGTPVIAYGKGGIEETMIPFEGNPSESTAIFFHNQSKEDLIKAVYEFEGIKLNRDFMINHAKKWSIPVFKEKLREYINEKK
jgi:glycosyltransferase involved in cell wall biosynthesis